ncbi:MAG: hypothetical protein LBC13_01210, partial [Clostridiales bacterium]|nr:hypothetical protein [Clostridiales bacterium]
MSNKKFKTPLSEAEQIQLILQKQREEESKREVLTPEEKHDIRVKKSKKAFKIVAVTLVSIICAVALLRGVSALTNNANMKLAKGLSPVKNAGAVTPFKDAETGWWTFETD